MSRLSSGHPPRALALAALSLLLCAGARAQTAPSSAASPPLHTKLYTSDIVVDAQGLETDTIHLEEQATNTAAAQSMGQFPIGYSESMEDVDIREAYTLKADGRKLPVAPAAIFTQLPRGASQEPMFDDMRQKNIVFPDVEAGDSIVVTYVTHAKQSLIPGQYFTRFLFPHSVAYDETSGSITVPKSLNLNVETHEVTLEKQDAGQTVTYHWHYAAPSRQETDTAVLSIFDRSPRLIVSSLKNYDDFAHAFAPLVTPKISVTDPIKALADQITIGTSGHREQAEKIYNWVSQHIRYVGIELGTGGIIPHDAPQILANGYGDCKDHVVLFAALLKAKGIDSEMVMINYGNAYTLPDTPIIGELNHAITWIPEFKLYADTTAGVAPFGVLPFAEYGKPVVHVVASGPALHQTPVLPQGLASVAYTTAAHLDDKGNIVGQTKTMTTGPFAITLRGYGKAIQAAGAERAATALLASLGVPGAITVSAPPPDAAGASYSIDSTYTLGPFPNILSGQRVVMPAQLEMLGHPGDTLVGPLANTMVKDSDPTPCYSGQTVEDITLDPPAGRKFLDTPPDINSTTPHISFKAHWSLNGSTVTLHREVTTKFDTALCSGDIRIETAKALTGLREQLIQAVALAVQATPEQQKFTADATAADVAFRQGDYTGAVKLFTTLLSSSLLPADRKWLVYYGRAQAYGASKQYDQALADYSAAIALNANNPDIYHYRGSIYFFTNDFDRAIADFSGWIRLKPDDAEAFFSRASAYYNKKDYDQTIADDSHAIQLKPDLAVAFHDRGLAYYNKKKYDLAEADYNQAIKLNPGYAEAFNDRGLIYAAQQNSDRAIADYGESIRLKPSLLTFQNRAAAYKAKNDWAHAIADYGQIVLLKPDDEPTYVNRGLAYGQMRDLDHAIADYSKAAELNPKDPAPVYDRGLAYYNKQDYDHAIADAGQAIALKPDMAEAFVNRANAYRAKKDTEHAIADDSEAIRLKPDNAVAFHNRGLVYADKQDYDQSLADNNDAIRLNPDFADAYVSRGFAEVARHDYDKGISDYSHALQLQPGYALALRDRAIAYAGQKDYDHALTDFNEAIRLEPQNAFALNGRAATYVGKQDYPHAIADYSEAIRLNSKVPDFFVNRGDAYGMGKNFGDAVADYSAALLLKPNDTVLLEKRGFTYVVERDFDHAIADFSQAIQINPNQSPAYNGRGSAYAAKQDFDHALADYNDAIRLAPTAPAPLMGRGTLYAQKKDFDRAIADFGQAIHVTPSLAIAYQLRGSAYANKQDYDNALTDFNDAIRLQPGNATNFLARANIYNAKKDYGHAIADEDDALRLNPNNGVALNQRCWDRALVNTDLEGALSDCQAALKQMPNEANLLDSRGFVYFRMGKFDLAKTDYDSAIAVTPKAATLYKRGIVKSRLGDADGGKADIGAALAIDPHAGDDMTGIGVTP